MSDQTDFHALKPQYPSGAKFEPWPEAYNRILEETKAEMPDADDDEQYAEYRRRCQQWKRERGIR